MDNDIKAYDTYRNRNFGEKGLPQNVRHELNIDNLKSQKSYQYPKNQYSLQARICRERPVSYAPLR